MMLPLSNDILVRDCWHCPQRRGTPARVRAKSRVTAICRALVKLPNSERLYVSIMAFSSGLLWMLLLPRVPSSRTPTLFVIGYYEMCVRYHVKGFAAGRILPAANEYTYLCENSLPSLAPYPLTLNRRDPSPSHRSASK